MTFELLNKIVEENNIPKDVKMMSDSGWECSETEMDGVYYNKEKNELVFTQSGNVSDSWFEQNDFELLYGRNKLCKKCRYLGELDDCKNNNLEGKYVGIYDTSNCRYFERK